MIRDTILVLASVGFGWSLRGALDRALTRLLVRLATSSVGKPRILQAIGNAIEGLDR